jgi:hypothetical protein
MEKPPFVVVALASADGGQILCAPIYVDHAVPARWQPAQTGSSSVALVPELSSGVLWVAGGATQQVKLSVGAMAVARSHGAAVRT